MRAMPSPTERTCPTSATSASVPNSAICCFRMAEISAARISIASNSLHGKPQPRELALERRIDHARAHLDDDAAEQARIDADVDGDLAADRLTKLFVHGLCLPRRQHLRRRHLGRHLAAPRRQFLEIAG